MRAHELLADCLVESDPAVMARRRRTRRISLLISLLLQLIVLCFLLLTPLFAKTERIAWKNVMPIPPYPRGMRSTEAKPAQDKSDARRRHPIQIDPSKGIFAPRHIPPTVDTTPEELITEDSPIGIGMPPCPTCDKNGFGPPIFDPSNNTGFRPKPPEEPKQKAKPPMKVSEPVQQALLVRRVEPKYSSIARQMGLQGKVELRAIIGRDGTIHSLELLSGHPILGRDAMQAIAQWRYQPTILNGEVWEVETRITVIFTLQR